MGTFEVASSFNQDISAWNVSYANNMYAMFLDANALSDGNKCVIHSSFSQQNENWSYDWSGYCAIEGYTFVPDDNFEQALIDLGYDDVLDNYVLTENISGVTELDVDNKEISDLTGIEGFTALTHLFCRDNQITSLNMSENTALSTLYCNTNELTSLDVSNNTALRDLRCGENALTSLDVSENTLLDLSLIHI